MAQTRSSSQPARDNQLVVGDILSSTSSKYLVQSILGQGAFGTVAKCSRVIDMRIVAIKMVKNEEKYALQTQAEVKALTKLRLLDPDKCNVVRWHQVFTDQGRTCLMFEKLDKSLFDLMRERRFRPLCLKSIRTIVKQLANALFHLKSIGMIHADLKLENVMLVNQEKEPYRVKVIDFGLACDVSSAKQGSYIQSRPYRSPEIILGLPFTQAIDMWSLGCVAAALYLGVTLYPGRSEYDMMRYIVETQGQPPQDLLNLGQKTDCFFCRDNTTGLWRLKTLEEFIRDTRTQPMETRRVVLQSLDDLLHTQLRNPENNEERAMFVDMVKAMLRLDASKRITPRQVLEHQFIRMSHIVSTQPVSSQNGQACPSTSTSSEVQTNCTRDSTAVRSRPVHRLDHTSTPPSTSSQVESGNGQGIKRKMADSEDVGQQTRYSDHNNRPHDDRKRFRPSDAGPSTSYVSSRNQSYMGSEIKRKVADSEDVGQQTRLSDHNNRPHNDRKRFRTSDAGPSTSRSSEVQTNCTQGSTAVRIRPVHRLDHTSTPPSTSSQVESGNGQGIKRKLADSEDVGQQTRYSDHNNRPHDDRKRFRPSDAGPSTSYVSSRNQSCIGSEIKRKVADSEDVGQQTRDSDHNNRPHNDRKRFRTSDAGPSTSRSSEVQTNCTQGSTAVRIRPVHRLDHTSTPPSTSSQVESGNGQGIKRKLADSEDVGQQTRDSDHNNRPHDDRKRFRPSDAGPSTLWSSSRNQSYMGSEIRRKVANSDKVELQTRRSVYYKRRQDDLKRFQSSDAGPSTSWSSSRNQSYMGSEIRRKDVGQQRRDSDYYKRPQYDLKRFQTSDAGPSTSSGSSRNQSCVSPRTKREMVHDEDADCSGRERQRVRESYAGRATCSSRHHSTHNLPTRADGTRSPAEHHCHSTRRAISTRTERRSPSGVKRKTADDDDVRRGKRPKDM